MNNELFEDAECGDRPVATEPVYPDWYLPSKYRVRGNRRVQGGLHPTGRRLGPADSRCGSCAAFIRVDYHNKVYFKCGVGGLWTHGKATDLCNRWRGCDAFATSQQ